MRKKYVIFPIISFSIILLFLLIIVINKNSIDSIIAFVKIHKFAGPFLLVGWRILGIIIPAIPAGIVSFGAVPIFGWFLTYIYSLIGMMIGAGFAFFLARIFREALVKRFMPLQKIHKMENEMSKKKEFMAVVALRLFTTPIMDFSSYIAGLTKINFYKFMAAVFIASLPDIAIFYLGESVYKRFFRGVAEAVAFFVLVAIFYYLFKKYKNRKKSILDV